MATTILKADIQSCQKNVQARIHRKIGLTSAVIETQGSFYAHFKARNTLSNDLLQQYNQHSYVTKVSKSVICPCISQNVLF
jgi:hypothetical protein